MLPPDAPIVLILHGIGGSADENYCRNLVDVCTNRGWRAVVHFRWRIDFGEHRDISYALEHMQSLYPAAPLLAVAYSAGAHVLLSYLQTVGRQTPLVGAVVESPALDLVQMINHLRSSVNSTYAHVMNSAIRLCVRRHLDHDKNLPQDVRDSFSARMGQMGAHELYDSFIAAVGQFTGSQDDGWSFEAGECPPIERRLSEEEIATGYSKFGYPTHGHYARTAAVCLHKVAVPCLVLQALDDPISAPEFFPLLRRAADANRHIILCTTKRGGHTAWHMGTIPTGPSWADYAIMDFCSALLSAHAHTAFMLNVVRRAIRSGVATSDHMSDTASLTGDDSRAGSPLGHGLNLASSLDVPIRPAALARICSASEFEFMASGDEGRRGGGRAQGWGGPPVLVGSASAGPLRGTHAHNYGLRSPGQNHLRRDSTTSTSETSPPRTSYQPRSSPSSLS